MRLADLDILVVDDHEAMRTLLLRVLNRAGVPRLRSAEAGAQALALLAERPANLILVDQSMPGMDGAAFIKTVRAEPALASARVIMITGRTETAQTGAARQAGADAVLIKPVTPRALLEAIDAVFAQS
ncbi:MAG: response regulator [Hyphomonadaceae bacterium]|nr:response regulator [Hyphomonadaceae bacterium]